MQKVRLRVVLAVLTIAVATVAGGGMAIGSVGSADSRAQSTAVGEARAVAQIPNLADRPSQLQIEDAFARAKECMQEQGITIQRSSLAVTRYDVSYALDSNYSATGKSVAESSAAAESCMQDFTTQSSAWTAHAGPIPFDELNRAVETCMATDVTGDAVANEGRCQREARKQVLGIPDLSRG